MVKQTIRIFCRVKPTKQHVGIYEVDDSDGNQSVISYNVPRELSDGIINNKKENYEFRFDQVFDQETKQDEIFAHVAQPVIDNVLSGFNGTLFAYGQTGSGKTFTITGGAERYIDRGIIPRTLSYIFNQMLQNAGFVFAAHISYLEIYNDNGYDLLDPKHEAAKIEDLPKISLLEDSDGNIHLKNLSIHQANNEEEALNLLFLGDTNRMIAETPMNQASTRSHCIFTIHLNMREPDSATVRRSKLHLVDLAGSERVGKTGIGGSLFKEATYINLSLHHLERVIIALSEKSRSHIPYRNSMMTSVLRDSLGGNCMTTMIATCSVEKKNIDESISTCRFAQRVAMIKNDAILNEELDPKLMIAKLKREIQLLKDELALAKGEQYESEVTEDEQERLQALVKSFIEDRDMEAMLSVGADMRRINYCFQLLKKYCIDNDNHNDETSRSPENGRISERTTRSEPVDNTYLANTSEMRKLKDLILQRDNEINILVNMLKKEKLRADASKRNTPKESFDQNVTASSERRHFEAVPDEEQRSERNMRPDKLSQKKKVSMSSGRQEAFEIFKRDYRENHIIDENKRGLRNRYADAKKLGQQVNTAREAINAIKAKLEKLKIRKSLKAASGGELVGAKSNDPEEQVLREQLDAEKSKYKEAFSQLKLLKTEIEHMQHLLEKAKVKMQKDFELWWAEEAAMLSQSQKEVHSNRRTTSLTSQESKNDDRPTERFPLKESVDIRASQSSEYVLNTPSQSINDASSHVLGNSTRSSFQSSSGSIMSSGSRPGSNVRLTGDQKTDEDIMAFMKAREELLRKARR